eukprot:TRINITY_DN11074_c0_g2_i6.p1 TRINITY_DN11074_c0_g2~~TRINITY_DN11074_c0_g2_i6.p1  ORF type:complete len:319 (-),score=83.57 TRINITY_DN11074_c0_g2_i6:83-1039(-)
MCIRDRYMGQSKYNDIKAEENAYGQLLEEKQEDLRVLEKKVFEISAANNNKLRDIARAQQVVESETLVNMEIQDTIDKILRINTSFSNVQMETKEKVGSVKEDIERMNVLIQELATELECSRLRHKSLCNELAVASRHSKRLTEEGDYHKELVVKKEKVQRDVERMELECEKLRVAIQNAKIVINERSNEVNDLLYSQKLFEEEKMLSPSHPKDIQAEPIKDNISAKDYTPTALRVSKNSNTADDNAGDYKRLSEVRRAMSGQKYKKFHERSNTAFVFSQKQPLTVVSKVLALSYTRMHPPRRMRFQWRARRGIRREQ